MPVLTLKEFVSSFLTLSSSAAAPAAQLLQRGLLAIDYGTTKCGLAAVQGLLSEPIGLGKVLPPLSTGGRSGRGPAALTPAALTSINAAYVERMKGLLKLHRPCALIIGWPLQPEGTQGPECRNVLRYLDALQAANVRDVGQTVKGRGRGRWRWAFGSERCASKLLP